MRVFFLGFSPGTSRVPVNILCIDIEPIPRSKAVRYAFLNGALALIIF